MDIQKIDAILQETAYVRTGGSPDELRCALYLQQQCKPSVYSSSPKVFGSIQTGIAPSSFTYSRKFNMQPFSY